IFLFISCDSSLVDQNFSEKDSLKNSVTSTEASKELSVDGQYMILFKGNKIPKGFEKDVEDAGGSIIYQHEIGFAFVAGLDDEAAENF
ncbi:hypothetical protein DF186_17310, partial [Enterococcus hirae]